MAGAAAPWRPMRAKAATEADLHKLRYPIYIQPKIDGIRITCHNVLGPVTRSATPVANKALRSVLSSPTLKGFDGEVVYGDPLDPDCFDNTTGIVRTHSGHTRGALFMVFDSLSIGTAETFTDRFAQVPEWTAPTTITYAGEFIQVMKVPTKVCNNWREVVEAYEEMLSAGWEGAMLRDPKGSYKQGVSTLNEAKLIKLKPVEDNEALIIGFEELNHNDNKAELNKLGYTERSGHKANLRPGNTLGAFVCEGLNGVFKGKIFNVAPGRLNHTRRKEIWDNQDQFLGEISTYTHQLIGAKNLPRFPRHKAFRMKEDM